MRPLDNIERSIEKMHVTTTAAADERILSDAFAALEESVQIEWAGAGPSFWRAPLVSRITKLAAAAVIIAAVLVGVEVFKRREPAPVPSVAQMERQRIEAMAAAGDVDGLVAMLSEGQFDSKVLAAKYLGDIGDERALPELERLYLLTEARLAQRYGYRRNPFAEPIEKIKKRVKAEQEERRVGADANEAAGADVNETPEADANQTGKMDIPAEAERVLDFFVVRKETGEPMAGVNLNIRIQREGPDDVWEAVTDERGHYKVEKAQGKSLYMSIEAETDGFVPMQVTWHEKEGHLEIPKSYTLGLEPGTLIGGFIENEEGTPIAGATVCLRARGGEGSKIEWVRISDHMVTSDANGLWVCDIMPAKLGYVGIRLTHSEYIDDESYQYHVPPSPIIEKLRDMSSVMVMKKGVDVVGRVVNSKGKPIENADVRQGARTTWGIRYPSTKADAEGRFEFKSTSPGVVLLTVQARGCAPDLKEINVRKGMRPVEFRLGPAQTIRGRVVDSNDRPIDGVEVSVNSWRGRESIQWEARTNSEGYFQWYEAPSDEVIFSFSKEGYMKIPWVSLSPEVVEHIIEMYRALRVSGKVVDANSKEPVDRFKLKVGRKWKQGSSTDWDTHPLRRFSNGRYEARFSESQYGYFVRVEADVYLPVTSRMFTEEEEDVVINFELEKGEGLSGVVYLANGEPAAGAGVVLCTTRSGAWIENGRFANKAGLELVESGADGRFSFPPQTEDYLLVIVHDEGYAEIADEQLQTDPNIFIIPWGRVEGVLDIGGQARAEERISLYYHRSYEANEPRVGFSYYTGADANGNFTLERVVPGRAKVEPRFKLSGGRTTKSHAEVIEVVAGETVDVTIGGRGRAVVGRLVVPVDYNEQVDWSNASGSIAVKLPEPARPEDFEEMIQTEKRAWSNAWRESEEGKVYEKMQWEQGRSYGVMIEEDGTFRAEDVPAGTYQLEVSVGERPGYFWWGAGQRSTVPLDYEVSLNYEFEVPDTNEGRSDEPLDIGTLAVQIKKHLGVGDPAPAFEAETFDGKQIRLAEYSGKVVVLIFWNSQNPSIIRELLEIEQICDIFGKGERLVVIGMSLDRDIKAAKRFAKENGLGWINCFPRQGTRVRVSEDYEIRRFPSTFVIGPGGKILAKNPSPLLLESTLEEALGIE